MSEESPDLKPWRSYETIYDQPNPRAYFRTLEPMRYRQPDVVAGFLIEQGARIASQLGRQSLRLLDFGCGYGALGAVLRHRLWMEDLYGYFRAEPASDFLTADRAFFAEHRRQGQALELGGLDVAARAVDYARDCGLIDQGFSENLTERDPGSALAAFFAETDLVVETGAVYDHVPACYARLLDTSQQRPWFLIGPRGDADTGPLQAVLRDRGYLLETLSLSKRRYRRFADREEQADCEERMRTLGRNVAEHSQAGWLVNPLMLARPEAQAVELPAAALGYG